MPLLLAASRDHTGETAKTSLFWVHESGGATPCLTLPSGGDTSYPGLVVRGDRLLVSYYSSHEGKAAVYLAQLRLEDLPGR